MAEELENEIITPEEFDAELEVDNLVDQANRQGASKKRNKYGLTPKQELFCQNYVWLYGMDAKKTVEATYNWNGAYSDNNHHILAQRLLNNPAIKRRIGDILRERDDHMVVDRLWVKTKLKDIAENGSSEQTKLKALELLGKNLTMFIDRSEIQQMTETPKDSLKELVEKRKEQMKQNAEKKDGDNVIEFKKNGTEEV